MYYLIIAAFLGVLLLNIRSVRVRSRLLHYVTKPLLIILLLAFYLLKADHVEILVVLALFAGLAGDALLMLPDKNIFFLAGLFSFLAGHIFYILAFIITAGNLCKLGGWFYLLAIPYLAASFAIFLKIKPYIGNLKPYVAGYILTIAVMGISSLTSILSAKNITFLLPIAGSILFIISDSCLAFAKFKKVKCRDGLIMITYGLAQLFITVWFALYR